MERIDFKKHFVPAFRQWDVWLRSVFAWNGGDPYPPYYRFASNEEIGTAEAYVGFPVYPGMWGNGRRFVEWIHGARQGNRHAAYEMILNTAPEVYTYMREESMMPLNALIILHANCGHSHFFKNNRHTNKVGADTIMQRMANWADRFAELEADPEFGIERLEYTADAALVLAEYCAEPSPKMVSNEVLRNRLEGELRALQAEEKRLGNSFDAEVLKRRGDLLKERLKRDPINPVRDIGSFILDPEQNPGLSDKEREVISIIFEIARYFRPQGDTKFMNEGFAEFVRFYIGKDPQACLPPNWRRYLATHFDAQFEADPTNRYSSPYWFSRYVYERQYAKNMGDGHEVEVPVPVFRKVNNPRLEANRLRALDAGQAEVDSESEADLNPDRTTWMIDDDGDVLEWTGEYRLIKKPALDFSHVFEIVRDHNDLTFFHTFLDYETFEEVHDKTMRWIDERIRQISYNLVKAGWNPSLTGQRMPKMLDEKLELVMRWQSVARDADAASQQLGNPAFPALPIELKWMEELLLFVKAYYADKRKFRNAHIANLTIDRSPDICVIDGGVDSANGRTLVLEHSYDPVTGQLRESWAQKSLQLLPRIWKQGGVKLLTYKDEIDEETGETKNAYKVEYSVDANGTFSERRL